MLAQRPFLKRAYRSHAKTFFSDLSEVVFDREEIAFLTKINKNKVSGSTFPHGFIASLLQE